MRSVLEIKRNIEFIQKEIRLARSEGEDEQTLDLMYEDLDELQEELWSVQSA